MQSGHPVLGLESSCDETAAAILAEDGTILAETVLSQQADHARFGGVVPEIAARAHLAHMPALIRQVLDEAGLQPADLGGVAASCGPGLIGGLIVGASVAKGIALAAGIPFLAINHLEAHALTARLPGLVEGGAEFPYLLLLLSGGHCQCVAVEGVGRYRLLGATIDDAVGEAFDKVGKLLGLPWPGGPALECLAATGDPSRFALPRPLLGRPGCDFSFSGLKTAVAQRVARLPGRPSSPPRRRRPRRQLPSRDGRRLSRPRQQRARHDARSPRPGARRRRRRQRRHPHRPHRDRRRPRRPPRRPSDPPLHRQRRHGRLGRHGAPPPRFYRRPNLQTPPQMAPFRPHAPRTLSRRGPPRTLSRWRDRAG